MEKDSLNQPTRLRRLEINALGSLEFVLARQELKSWHTHVDFTHLHTLMLKSPLDSDALQWLVGCDFASLRVLNFQLKIRMHLRSSQTILELARSFVTSVPPLSELTMEDRWSAHILEAVYQRHSASLHTLRLPKSDRGAIDKAALILEMKDQCPQLTDLEITIRRDQGSRAEMAIYKAFASFPSLRRLKLGLRIRLYELERQQTHYDGFDRRAFQGSRYGEIRKTFIDQAVDENFAKTVFHLISPRRRSCGLEELELTSRNEGCFYGPQSPIADVLNHICRSWKISRGVRDDRPDELVTQEVGADDRERKPAPQDLHRRVKKIFRRIWTGSEDGTSDSRNDWHSIIQLDDDDVVA